MQKESWGLDVRGACGVRVRHSRPLEFFLDVRQQAVSDHQRYCTFGATVPEYVRGGLG
jgi:hypothetical protein